MTSSITVVPRTHWLNGWFLRMFARPVVRVGGVEHTAAWGHPLRTNVAAGTHDVGVGARYRGSASPLGVSKLTIEVAAGDSVELSARNGLFNHQPFTLSLSRNRLTPSRTDPR